MAAIASIRSRFGSLRIKEAKASEFRRSLLTGLLYGAIFFALLTGWMALRAGDTAVRLQDRVPFKTAVIEVGEEAPPARQETPAEEPAHPGQESLGDAAKVEPLTPAPVEGLTEQLEGRLLPKSRIEDDLTPFEGYRRPAEIIAGKTLIALVVVDFGLSETLSRSLLDNLPPDISLALTPYSADAAKWGAAARAFGHEFWLTLPMQTNDFGRNDPGPQTLLADASQQQNAARLFEVMGSAVGYAGIVSQKNHVLSDEQFDARPVMEQIFGRGLAFAESNPDINALGLPLALEFGYPYVQNSIWLDEELRPEAVSAALQRLEIEASRNGHAVAFMRPYPMVIAKVQEWIESAGEKNIQLVPLSALARAP